MVSFLNNIKFTLFMRRKNTFIQCIQLSEYYLTHPLVYNNKLKDEFYGVDESSLNIIRLVDKEEESEDYLLNDNLFYLCQNGEDFKTIRRLYYQLFFLIFKIKFKSFDNYKFNFLFNKNVQDCNYFKFLLSCIDKKRMFSLWRKVEGKYVVHKFKEPMHLNVVAADFNFKTLRLVFKKKVIVKTKMRKYFLRKRFFGKIKLKLINFALLSNCDYLVHILRNKSFFYLKFFVKYRIQKKSHLSAISKIVSSYREVNYRIKQVTLIPTILKARTNTGMRSSIPSKIPMFFVNFLYKHH